VTTSGASRSTAPSVDFNFPAGASDVAFIEQPDPSRPAHTQLMRFRRDAQAEAAAVQVLFEQLELRPWSRVAAFALDRMAALKAGRLQSAALPPALEDGQLMLVPTARDQWPMLLSRHIPALQDEGWVVERSDDFPFEVFETDDFDAAAARLASMVDVAAVTRGESGSVVLSGDERVVIAAVPVGKVTVMLRAPGYEPVVETIEVREGGEPAQLKKEMKKKGGN
jgi:hypothetical protein